MSKGKRKEKRDRRAKERGKEQATLKGKSKR
jgi:hypothetical protein